MIFWFIDWLKLDWFFLPIRIFLKFHWKKSFNRLKPNSYSKWLKVIIWRLFFRKFYKKYKENDLHLSTVYFDPRRAIHTNLLETIDFVTRCMKRKIPVDIVLIDLCKVFDKVYHRTLILKLENLGIGDHLIGCLAEVNDYRQRSCQ